MALRCVYTDLDGTLLGRWGSLFRDSEGEFSMLQARALEACHRADVEVVIKSGRREGSVLEDAKLIGSRSYIAEVGCVVVIDGERTELVGDAEVEEGKTLAETMVDSGIPDELFQHFASRLEWHSPWHREQIGEDRACRRRRGRGGQDAGGDDGRQRHPRRALPALREPAGVAQSLAPGADRRGPSLSATPRARRARRWRRRWSTAASPTSSSSTSRAGWSGTVPGTGSAPSRCSSAARLTSRRRTGCSPIAGTRA